MRTTRRNFIELLRLTVSLPIAWGVPEKYWNPICLRLAKLNARINPQAINARARTLAMALGHQAGLTDPRKVVVERSAAELEDKLQILRELRPGASWKPDVLLRGEENLSDAMSNGQGVILWVNNFADSRLFAKMAIYRAGYPISHLSRPTHGFLPTGFAVRVLNPFWARAENHYLKERIVIRSEDTRPAMTKLRQRLNEHGVVSITVGPWARKLIATPFLAGYINLPPGPIRLAQSTGAVLLPVFTVRGSNRVVEVHVTPPLMNANDEGDVELDIESILRKMATRLERYVIRYPHLWRGWSTVRFY
jgi:lauroyl/myristoyl acyltransferase